MLNTQFFEPIYIRPEIKLRWADLMAVTMPRQKSNPDAVQPSYTIRARWGAKGRVQRDMFTVGQCLHLVESTAAENADSDIRIHVHHSPQHLSTFFIDIN
jgi:hypothetical protein